MLDEAEYVLANTVLNTICKNGTYKEGHIHNHVVSHDLSLNKLKVFIFFDLTEFV